MTFAGGEFAVQAHERIMFDRLRRRGGARRGEALRCAARLLVTNRSLARQENGPLQRGPLLAGTFAAMSAHSRRKGVVAALNAAREVVGTRGRHQEVPAGPVHHRSRYSVFFVNSHVYELVPVLLGYERVPCIVVPFCSMS